jgi:hypothetical protein
MRPARSALEGMTAAAPMLAGQQVEANEIAESIDQGHDFGARAAYGLILSSRFCAGAMLVDPDERAIDEDIFEIRIVAERLEDPFPGPLLRQKRVYTVNHLPNASGRSRHCEPVRAIKELLRYTAGCRARYCRARLLCPTAKAQSAPTGRRSTLIASRLTSIFSLESSFLPIWES